MLGSVLRTALSSLRPTIRRWGARIRALSTRPEVSVVICSADDSRFAQSSANWRDRLGDRRYQLIRISDARSLCEGYNRGLARSRGELVVFCHDDIELLQTDAYDRIVTHLRSADLVGVAGTSRLIDGEWGAAGQPDNHGQVLHPAPTGSGYTIDVFGFESQSAGKTIQALDGLFLATRRSVAQSLGFDAQRFDGFHLYDIDFTYRAYLAGYRLAVCHDVLIFHRSRGQHNADWYHYCEVFREKFADRLPSAQIETPTLYTCMARDKNEALALFNAMLRGKVAISSNVDSI